MLFSRIVVPLECRLQCDVAKHGLGGDMWYVVQTKSDNEHLVMALLERMKPTELYDKLFIPMFEDVRKKDGTARIHLRRLFPGYFFVDTEDPDGVFKVLKRIPEFTRLLGSEENDGTDVFIPVDKDDEAFLDSLMENGLMKVSFVKRSKSGRIEQIIGPLSKYSNRIIKFDVSRRRAIVKADIFGKERKLKFGLWTDKDPELPWVTEEEKNAKTLGEAALLKGAYDIGIYPGDKVIDDSGVYEEQVFTVTNVDSSRRIIYTTIDMFGTSVNLQFGADDVRKI